MYCIDCVKELNKNAKYAKNKRCSSCANKGKNNPNFGKRKPLPKCINCGKTLSTRKCKRCTKCSNKGATNPNYKHGKSMNNKICIDCGKEISRNAKRCSNCASKMRRKLGVYKQKMNKKERYILQLLNKLNIKDYKYVGDGKFFIESFNPDFINTNGQKKIIEFYGDYWHNRKDVKIRDTRRLKTFKKYGYATLIIWEHELKNLKLLENKIFQFSYGGN